MRRVLAEFSINTPLFAGGSCPGGNPEIRISALKGVLRFWWRARAHAHYGEDIAQRRAREDGLFGSTKSAAGIRMSLSPSAAPACMPGSKAPDKGCVHPRLKEARMAGARYLGYGLMEAFPSARKATMQGQLWRPAIIEGQRFTMLLSAREGVPADVLDAVKLLGLLGGFGGRSRRGYGSITLDVLRSAPDAVPFWEAPNNSDELASELAQLLIGRVTAKVLPPYSAFYAGSRVTLLDECDDPLELLNRAGDRMVRYRSWGHNGTITTDEGQIASDQRFPNDHGWAKKQAEYYDTAFHPARSVFGLPHNYSKYPDLHVTPAGTRHERRASPLLLHIHRFADKRFGLIATILKSVFLPDREEIWAGHHAVPCNVNYDVIDDFIDGQFGKSSRRMGSDYFPRRIELV